MKIGHYVTSGPWKGIAKQQQPLKSALAKINEILK